MTLIAVCDCEFDGAVTCDPVDGSCQCLPGVTGSMCEQCLDRWVLIPQEGCQGNLSKIWDCLHRKYLHNNVTFDIDKLPQFRDFH